MSDTLVIRGAREHNLQATSASSCRATSSSCSPGCRARASRSWPSTPSTPRASAATSSRCRPTPASSSARWTSPTSTSSRACRRPSRSTRSRRRRNPRSTVGTITEVYDYLRLLYARIGVPALPRRRRAAAAPDARSRSSTASWSCPRAPASRCWRRWCGAARASTRRCSTTSPAQGFVAGPDRRRDRRHRRVPEARASPGPLRAAHDRGRRRPAGAARGHRAPAHRLAGDGAAAGRGRGRDRDRAPRGRGRQAETLTFSQHLACPTCGKSATRSWRPATSRSTRRTAPARLRRAGHHVRGRPRAGRPRPRPVDRRGRHRPVAQRPARSTSPGCSRRWPRPTASTSTRRGRSSTKAKQQKVMLVRRQGQRHGQVQEPLRPPARSTPRRTRASSRGSSAATGRRERLEPRADRGLHARGAVPGVRRRPPQAGVAGRHHRRHATSPRSATCRSARRPSSSPRSS